jgi:hypothetical protein
VVPLPDSFILFASGVALMLGGMGLQARRRQTDAFALLSGVLHDR